MLLTDNREPKSIQALLSENERLRAGVRQLTKALDGILRVIDYQGVWGLVNSQEIKDARQAFGIRWEIPDAARDIIQDIVS